MAEQSNNPFDTALAVAAIAPLLLGVLTSLIGAQPLGIGLICLGLTCGIAWLHAGAITWQLRESERARERQ